MRNTEYISVTVHVPAGRIAGEVTRSGDARLPVGTLVGLRLADFKGISEPSATVDGVIFPIVVLAQERQPGGSQDVTFALLEAPGSSLAPGGGDPDRSVER